MREEPPLTRAERLRRVVILCCDFTRNLAFYRAGWTKDGQPLLSESHPHCSFWRQANSNFLDICVLDWCKLFGDKKAEHYWGRIVSNRTSFETQLLKCIRMDTSDFQKQIEAMRNYRDKFVAHLDSLRRMDIPMLDAAQASVRFYHSYLMAHEMSSGADIYPLPKSEKDLSHGYDQCFKEAHAVFLSDLSLSIIRRKSGG